MKTRLVLLLTTALLAFSACSTNHNGGSQKSSEDNRNYVSGTYENPLFVSTSAGSYYKSEIADPCVVRGDDGYVYCFATAGRVLRSEDGCDWQTYSENIIPRPKWGDSYADNPIIWAPDVIKVKDQWIYYYSLSAWGGPCGIGYATADEIAGPYTDQGMLFASAEVGGDKSLGVTNSIDSQTIIDDDGSGYMVFGSFVGCYMVQLTEDGMGMKNGHAYQREHKILISATPGGFTADKFEGSWIFKRDDTWYYMGSTGSCCAGKNSTYHVLAGKSDSITGPYVDSEGHPLNMGTALDAGDLVVWSKPSNEETRAPGHNSIIMDDAGDFWWYGHCYYDYDNFATRHLAMDKVLWDDNDMPYLEGKELTYHEELDGPRWLAE